MYAKYFHDVFGFASFNFLIFNLSFNISRNKLIKYLQVFHLK